MAVSCRGGAAGKSRATEQLGKLQGSPPGFASLSRQPNPRRASPLPDAASEDTLQGHISITSNQTLKPSGPPSICYPSAAGPLLSSAHSG